MHNRYYISKTSKSDESRPLIPLKATLGQRVLSFRITDVMEKNQITPAQLANMVSDGYNITVTENDIKLLLSRKWWPSPQLSVIICYVLDIPISPRFREIKDAERIKEKKVGFKHPAHTDNTDWERYKNTITVLERYDGIESELIYQLLRVTASYQSLIDYGDELKIFNDLYGGKYNSQECLQSMVFDFSKKEYREYSNIPSFTEPLPYLLFLVQRYFSVMPVKLKKFKRFYGFNLDRYMEILNVLRQSDTVVKDFLEPL